MDLSPQEDGSVTISREELYRQVWQEPMTKVAPRYGLSDVGLAKVCRKYDIPRPPVGHWAKLGFGHHVEQTPLPELDDESLKEIHFFREQFFGNATQSNAPARDAITVEVAARLSNPHVLVSQSKEILSAGEATGRTLAKCLSISVSPSSLPRALRIFDALIKKWEERGGRVTICPDATDGRTQFAMEKDSVGVSLTEVTECAEVKEGHRHWAYCKRKHTGRLVLEISGRWFDGLRRRWADGKKQQVEKLLGSFLQNLETRIANEKECRFDNECEARQRQRAEHARQERKRQQERLEQRRQSLEDCAENWRRSEAIRSYLATLEATLEKGNLRPTDPESFPEWLRWAKWYADYLDPLTATPECEEYAKAPTNINVQELDLTRNTKAVVDLLGTKDTDALSLVDRKTVHAASERRGWSAWTEIGRVLEGLGYDVSSRDHSYF